MKTVVRLLPTGNVTTTYQDQLRHTHCAWKHTHAHRCTGLFALHSVLNMHIQTDTSDSWICACWHIYIWAWLSWPVPWCRVTGLMPLPPGYRWGGVTMWQERRQRDAFHSTVSVQWHNLSCCFSHIPEFSSAEVTFDCVLMWLMTCCLLPSLLQLVLRWSGAAPVMLAAVKPQIVLSECIDYWYVHT